MALELQLSCIGSLFIIYLELGIYFVKLVPATTERGLFFSLKHSYIDHFVYYVSISDIRIVSNAIGFMTPKRNLMKYIHASMYPPPLAQLQSCHYDDRYTDNMKYNIFSSNIHGEYEFSKRFKLISIAIHDQQNHVTMYEHDRCTGYYGIQNCIITH